MLHGYLIKHWLGLVKRVHYDFGYFIIFVCECKKKYIYIDI